MSATQKIVSMRCYRRKKRNERERCTWDIPGSREHPATELPVQMIPSASARARRKIDRFAARPGGACTSSKDRMKHNSAKRRRPGKLVGIRPKVCDYHSLDGPLNCCGYTVASGLCQGYEHGEEMPHGSARKPYENKRLLHGRSKITANTKVFAGPWG